jgi:hypothetical protein
VCYANSMNDVAFWKLDTLSDRQLLEGLGAVLGSGRRLTAELIAHLAEVEDRRLHLEAACSSMFSYCVNRLGLSEDSVAALLKPHLSADNPLDPLGPLNGLDPLDLLTAVSGKSVQQAREVLATRFPRPDVPSRVRKLPERCVAQPRVGALGGPGPSAPGPDPIVGSARVAPAPEACPGARDVTSLTSPSVASRSPASGSTAGRIEPLAAQRYKVQFTADTELKGKLELARDLMRHVHPSGDFAPIVGRALDLLIEDLMKRRFGSGARRKAPSTATPSVASNASRTAVPSGTAKPADTLAPCDVALRPSQAAASHHVRLAARRSVLERDGLRCSWVDAGGARCDSRAWLEHDHRQPRGKGGDSGPDNLRLLCRAHNCLAAEREYGRRYMDRVVAQKGWKRPPPPPLS